MDIGGFLRKITGGKKKKKKNADAKDGLSLRSSGAVRTFGEEKKESRTVKFDAEYFFRVMTQISAAAFAVCMTAYFGYHMIRTFTSDIKTTPVYTLTQTVYAEGTAYMIREETPVKSGDSGYPVFSLPEGSRIAKGENICSIYSGMNTADVKREIDSIDAEVAGLRKSLGAGTVVSGILDVSSGVSDMYSGLMKKTAAGDYSSAAADIPDFKTVLGRLTYLSGSGGGMMTRLQNLLDRRSSLISSLGSPIKNVRSPEAGYVYYSCDGYEEIFTPELVKTFSEESFAAALSAQPVSAAGTVCKLVTDPEWYCAVVTDDPVMAGLNSGDTRRVTFAENGGTSVSMKLEKKIRTDKGVILLFSSSVMPDGFSFQRCQKVRIDAGTVSGYRVPVSAVHRYEGMTGVFTMHGGYVYFRKINVISEGEGYYLVSEYSDVEKGAPLTYRVLGFDDRGKVGDYIQMHETAKKLGLERTYRDNGGIPVRYGETYLHYYYLNGLEEIITSGRNLYHGKVLG